MNKMYINLSNCYGIKRLSYNFDFQKHSNYLIYASNGMMKTSFTKTFRALRNGKNHPMKFMENILPVRF